MTATKWIYIALSFTDTFAFITPLYFDIYEKRAASSSIYFCNLILIRSKATASKTALVIEIMVSKIADINCSLFIQYMFCCF